MFRPIEFKGHMSGTKMIWLIVTVCAPFAFAPFTFWRWSNTEYDREDIFLVPQVRESATACFAVTVPFLLVSLGEIVSRLRTSSTNEDDLGLSPVERFQYMYGTFGLNVVVFLPLSSSPWLKVVVFNCFTGYSSLLMLSSVVSFLNRSTPMWTDAVSISCILFSAIGVALMAASFCYMSQPNLVLTLNLAGGSSAAVGLIIFFTVCFASLRSHLRHHNIGFFGSLKSSFALLSSIETSEELIAARRSLVPALHMCLTGYMFLSVTVLTIMSSFFTSQTMLTTILFYNYFFGAVLIIVIEYYYIKQRLRQHLLFAVSSTKRAYIRYISHELRTPMNAAIIGMQLLDNETGLGRNETF